MNKPLSILVILLVSLAAIASTVVYFNPSSTPVAGVVIGVDTSAGSAASANALKNPVVPLGVNEMLCKVVNGQLVALTGAEITAIGDKQIADQAARIKEEAKILVEKPTAETVYLQAQLSVIIKQLNVLRETARLEPLREEDVNRDILTAIDTIGKGP